MAGKPKYSPLEVIEAIEISRKLEGSQQGLITRTAACLGCTRQTVHNYINRWPEVWEAYMRVRYRYGENWGPDVAPETVRFRYD